MTVHLGEQKLMWATVEIFQICCSVHCIITVYFLGYCFELIQKAKFSTTGGA